MKKFLLPDCMVENVGKMDAAFYEKNGIKALVFDIDNTLCRHTDLTPPKDVLDYFEYLCSLGIKYAIVSNNSHERVESFCASLGVPYYGKALKPRAKYIKKAISDMGSKKEETALVGDQLFTDILGGNLYGLFTVLVTAVGEDETGFVSFKRKFEKRILEKNFDKIPKYKSL